MSGHTPAPWGFGWEHETEIQIEDASNRVLCHVVGGLLFAHPHGPNLDNEMMANACLIAAAPDLLSALREIADHHIEINTKAFRPLDHSKTLGIALAAIRKAESKP